MSDPVDPWDGDELRQRARKVDPRYSEGPLVKVARARHQAEAEMMENLLLEQGIPALAKRSGGFDVPDFLAAGPRDIFVPASGAEAARETLGVDNPEHAPGSTVHATPAWVRTLAVVLAILLLVVIAAFVITAIV
jgi:hypothetical protein